jgi:hypothetical protein
VATVYQQGQHQLGESSYKPHGIQQVIGVKVKKRQKETRGKNHFCGLEKEDNGGTDGTDQKRGGGFAPRVHGAAR